MSKYELIGYCSYRDTETGVIGDNFVEVLNEQDQKIKDLETKLAEERNKVCEKIRKKFPMPKDDIPDEITYSLNEFLDQIERGTDD